jgi:hypothetical protein
MLATFEEALPGNEFSPAYPFSGFVVNLNTATRFHRDNGDLNICLVLVVSRCVGGGLMFFEAGIILDLDNGCSTFFPSAEFSHANENYEGYRSSIVFHSDAAAEAWTGVGRAEGAKRNGWKQNRYFRST